jgi:hypothetical protein
MTEPTQRQIDAMVEARTAAAKAMMKGQQDALLKSIFTAAHLKVIDKWIAANDPTVDRPEAIRRLVELGLKAKK